MLDAFVIIFVLYMFILLNIIQHILKNLMSHSCRAFSTIVSFHFCNPQTEANFGQIYRRGGFFVDQSSTIINLFFLITKSSILGCLHRDFVAWCSPRFHGWPSRNYARPGLPAFWNVLCRSTWYWSWPQFSSKGSLSREELIASPRFCVTTKIHCQLFT